MATRSIALKNQDTVIAMNTFAIYLCNKKYPKFILDEKNPSFFKEPPHLIVILYVNNFLESLLEQIH